MRGLPSVAISSSAAANNRTMASEKCVNLENLNPCIKVMEYAVRGPLVIRATEIEKELEQVRGEVIKSCFLVV